MPVTEEFKKKVMDHLRKQGIEPEKLQRESEESQKRIEQMGERIRVVREIWPVLPFGPDLYGHAVAAVQQVTASMTVVPSGSVWNEGELATLKVEVRNKSKFTMTNVVLDLVVRTPSVARLVNVPGFPTSTRHLGTLLPDAAHTEIFLAQALSGSAGLTAEFGASVGAEPDLLVRAPEQVGGRVTIVAS